MTDKEKFYKLALNIVNYPYDKAVYSWKGKITEVRVFPHYGFRHNFITLTKDSDEYDIIFILNDRVRGAGTNKFGNLIDDVIDEINNKVINEAFKKALLEGIE